MCKNLIKCTISLLCILVKLLGDFIYSVMSDKFNFVRHIQFVFYNDGNDGRSWPNHLIEILLRSPPSFL